MENLSRRNIIAVIGIALTWVTGSSAMAATKIKKKKVLKKPTAKPSAKPSAEPSASKSAEASSTPTATPSATASKPNDAPVAIFSDSKAVLLSSLSVGENINAQYTPIGGSKKEIVVHRAGTSEVVAFTAICTHQGCIVDAKGDPSGKNFICPCHGSSFDTSTGKVTFGPASRSLAQIPVVIKDGALFI